MTMIGASFVDAAIVLAGGLAATALLRQRSAAMRHAILTIAIVMASVMPALEWALPQTPIGWRDSLFVVSPGATSTAATASPVTRTGNVAPVATGISWTGVLFIVWLSGAVVLSAGLITALVRVARLVRRSTPVGDRWRALTDEISRESGVTRHVTLLQSDAPSVLVTCGVVRPRIILPAGASTWSDERMRIILRHELAHVKRYDAAIQVWGELVRVLHWVNPLAWVACRRLRLESEYACDDAVLTSGIDATEYATHLFDVAKHLSGQSSAWVSAPAIAHPSTLERRIVVMLSQQQNRAAIGRRGWWAAALVALSLSIPLAAVAPSERSFVVLPESRAMTIQTPARVVGITPDAPLTAATPLAAPIVPPAPRDASPRTNDAAVVPQALGTIEGTASDQTGGVLPGVLVTLTDTQTGAARTAYTSGEGRFLFRDLGASQYEIAARLGGFATISNTVTLGAGASLRGDIRLALGSLEETVNVRCGGIAADLRGGSRWPRFQQLFAQAVNSAFPVLSAQAPPGVPVRVGGVVRPPVKVKHVDPFCPAGAPAGETTVQLKGVLSIDGGFHDLTPVSAELGAAPPAEFVAAAVDAVRQWRFMPAALNGQPTEVNFGVKVVFNIR